MLVGGVTTSKHSGKQIKHRVEFDDFSLNFAVHSHITFFVFHSLLANFRYTNYISELVDEIHSMPYDESKHPHFKQYLPISLLS